MLSLSLSLIAIGLRRHPIHRYWTLLLNIFSLKFNDILPKGNFVVLPTLTFYNVEFPFFIIFLRLFSISDVFLSINNNLTSHWNGIVSRILWRSWNRKQKASVRVRWCHGGLPELLGTRWYSISNVSYWLKCTKKEQNLNFEFILYSA